MDNLKKISADTDNPLLDRFLAFVWDDRREEREGWYEIKGTDGLYFISNRGNVLSLQNNKATLIGYTDTDSKYNVFCIYIDGNRQYRKTHQVVAEYFLYKPEEATIVHHIDGDKLNNDVSNLVWLTPQQHAKAHKVLKK